MDVCLRVELLEHVPEWKECITEGIRILKPGGVLFVTTSNKLCPVQDEFNLPLYSWYPKTLKRYFERMARTTRPQLVNFAKYPAVNWFSFYELRTFLLKQSMQCLDRFDLLDIEKKNLPSRVLTQCIRRVPFLRWLAHLATPGTTLLALRQDGVSE
jgi:2-polyprenyl-6-hydroxyphenyl methylase/3-demethylubiquinone-9 3-methyltransferase